MPLLPVTLHTESLGPADASQAVVFLHGLAGSTASWLAPFRALAPVRRVVLVDLLGFGQSPKPAIAYTLDDHLMALHATLTGLGIARAHLVGHSMGALLALAYAARFPHAVQGLVLLALPWYTHPDEARQKIGAQSLFNRWLALETPLAHLACTAMCRLRPWLTPLMPHLVRDVPAQVARDVLRHNWLSYSRTMQHVIIEAQPAEWLRQVQVPILVIQGRQDDTAAVAPVQRGIADAPNVALEIVDAGHHLIFTQASELATRLRTFFPNDSR